MSIVLQKFDWSNTCAIYLFALMFSHGKTATQTIAAIVHVFPQFHLELNTGLSFLSLSDILIFV